MEERISKSDEEWRRVLTPEQYRVMRQQGTEAPFTGKYTAAKDSGVYRCAACGAELFSSDAKFDSGTGWPSFTDPMNRENVLLREDLSGGMRRVEVRCKRCGSHLGHVFDDLPRRRQGKAGGPTDRRLPAGRRGKRYCINSCALDLERK
ncbi:MAG: peptide-methionine (R)-S-oxide reductase MsrB [Candidatus Sungbacteria bacterium]|uniref:peptide-methionine (R)-S-oxide reductase n=1 Tax=Candidatus Sungiibacteriota bacterium TaxID=2750080 RepID=A0A933DSU5_9BACT|nr:peptide-methionine (R)-S-oxide reductase MsrB [Candidatus Sungbacteria bacterium]